jgi:hypothetical protein
MHGIRAKGSFLQNHSSLVAFAEIAASAAVIDLILTAAAVGKIVPSC